MMLKPGFAGSAGAFKALLLLHSPGTGGGSRLEVGRDLSWKLSPPLEKGSCGFAECSDPCRVPSSGPSERGAIGRVRRYVIGEDFGEALPGNENRECSGVSKTLEAGTSGKQGAS